MKHLYSYEEVRHFTAEAFLSLLVATAIYLAISNESLAKPYDYQVIEPPCEKVFCFEAEPYWKHQSREAWIDMTEEVRPNRYYIERSGYSIRIL